MAWTVPLMIVFIVLYGGVKGVDITDAFARGVKKGLGTLMAILPAMMLMTVAIQMAQGSGLIERLSAALMPAASRLGLPSDCLPLALLRPFSSSGALSVGMNIMERFGPDSYQGRVAAVMLGASESSLYTIGIYSSATGIKKGGRILAAAFVGDITAFIASAFFARLM